MIYFIILSFLVGVVLFLYSFTVINRVARENGCKVFYKLFKISDKKSKKELNKAFLLISVAVIQFIFIMMMLIIRGYYNSNIN
ncbi:hypothetical protein GCM10022395_08410 [Snuella lapsa]|uniref:Uncharacterized protein n=1 Tax=Snuella lapsa TaxID=870481 RepID=A0ABP6X177_9FLAO